MKGWLFRFLIFVLCVSACTPAEPLPAGITRIKGIDTQGLEFPLWSPDGKKIAASYSIYPLADFSLGPKPRNDVVVIDTETWQMSVVAHARFLGRVRAEAWLPDNRRLAVVLPGTEDTDGIYVIDGSHPLTGYLPDSSEARRLSKAGALSPELNRIASYDAQYVTISNIDGSDSQQFRVPGSGDWWILRWSRDGRWVALQYLGYQAYENLSMYLLNVESGSFIPIRAEGLPSESSPQLSPSGELLAYVTSQYIEKSLEHKLTVSRLDHVCQWTIPLDDAQDFAWSPDSQRMFIIGRDDVYLADLNVVFGSSFPSGKACH